MKTIGDWRIDVDESNVWITHIPKDITSSIGLVEDLGHVEDDDVSVRVPDRILREAYLIEDTYFKRS